MAIGSVHRTIEETRLGEFVYWAWDSKKQEISALSTAEAQYVVATSSAYQAIYIRRLLSYFGLAHKEAAPINRGSKSTIAITRSPTQHQRTKHVDLRFHFIRNLILDGSITLKYCSTNKQVADIMT